MKPYLPAKGTNLRKICLKLIRKNGFNSYDAIELKYAKNSSNYHSALYVLTKTYLFDIRIVGKIATNHGRPINIHKIMGRRDNLKGYRSYYKVYPWYGKKLKLPIKKRGSAGS